MTPALCTTFVGPAQAAFALLCSSPSALPALEGDLRAMTLCPSFPYREAPGGCSQAAAPVVLDSGHAHCTTTDTTP